MKKMKRPVDLMNFAVRITTASRTTGDVTARMTVETTPMRSIAVYFSVFNVGSFTVLLQPSYSALLSAEPVTCNHKDFACASGDCISARFRCDGDYDCADNSDEKDCETHCEEDQFQCHNNLCISRKWLCDGQEDCKTGEDERNCLGTDAFFCRPDEFICNNTLCKLHVWVCDGEDDCGDNSDEDPEMCAKLPCPPARPYRCRNDRMCLRLDQICNNVDNCGDNSDEDECEIVSTRPKPCGKAEFTCSNRKCIPAQLQCDLFDDCGDGGSDEQDCKACTCFVATQITCDTKSLR
ncbi:hypothetical protein cypCar_00029347 [Cyprinus carpio]|nr:hypothetical protein cypCar_00029347 [Cyprinus carpio]